MAYRDEAEALRARIALLEERYQALRAARDDVDRQRGEGRHHPRRLARAMYRAGQQMGRWIRARQMQRYATELEATRVRLAWFEAKLAEQPESVRGVDVPRPTQPLPPPVASSNEQPATRSADEPPPTRGTVGYRMGRALRKLFR
jgi:hypothetical protein